MSRKFNKHNKIREITTADGQRYRLHKIIDPTSTNIHHVLWQCHKEYNTGVKENKIKVNEIRHNNLNLFYWNRQSPHEQLKYMLDEWRSPVLSQWVKDELYAILSLPRWEFYIDGLVKEKDKDKELFSNNESPMLKETL